jgi:hypothetical protein
MFVDLFDTIRAYDKDFRLDEVLTQAELSRMQDEVATPEILPETLDRTIAGWLERIGTWGKITIYHKNPEKWRGKKKVTPQQFINGLDPDIITQYFGRWEFVKKGLTKVECQRVYFGINGKKYTEKFIISVKLKKELR